MSAASSACCLDRLASKIQLEVNKPNLAQRLFPGRGTPASTAQPAASHTAGLGASATPQRHGLEETRELQFSSSVEERRVSRTASCCYQRGKGDRSGRGQPPTRLKVALSFCCCCLPRGDPKLTSRSHA